MADLDDQAIDPALAAAMGFSTFGAAPAAKRRKYNDASDSYIAGQADPAPVKARREKVQGSGANNTSLGIRGRGVENAATAGGGAAGNGIGQAQPEANAQFSAIASERPEQDVGDETEKVQVPSKRGKAKEAKPAGLAAFLSRGEALPTPNPTPTISQSDPKTAVQTTRVEAEDVRASSSLVDLPSRGTDGPKGEARGLDGRPAKHDLAAYRRGVLNERGDMVYFLPSFLEDPWATLEGGNG